MQPGMTRIGQLPVLLTTLLSCLFSAVAAAGTASHTVVATPIWTGTCESRIINYVTALPNFESVCYRQRRNDTTVAKETVTISSATYTVGGGGVEDASIPKSITTQATGDPVASETEIAAGYETDDVFSDASFLSFEDWKRQIIEKSEDEVEGARGGERRRKPEENEETLDTLGDYEIDINIEAFLEDNQGNKGNKPGPSQSNDKSTYKHVHTKQPGDEKVEKPVQRSKDAGKTCKERTNFASFDSGAQVMKANPEAKSTSALLSENRDAYMLNTCSAKNKFVIVELSDSILVETVGLANFEFFSSTFREFRVSVSDRYPVKLDRWVDLGTFEAKNSREIQAFLIEDPRVWARYLRIEFLSQYGNEFYCPISLLRVHGRTMIQDVLSTEQSTGGDDEEEAEDNLREAEGENFAVEAVAEVIKEETNLTESVEDRATTLEDLVGASETFKPDVSNSTILPNSILENDHIFLNDSMEFMTTPWSKYNLNSGNIFGEPVGLEMSSILRKPPPKLLPTTTIVANKTSPAPTLDPPPITTTNENLVANSTVPPTPEAAQPTVEQSATDILTPPITPTPVVEAKPQPTTDVPVQETPANSSVPQNQSTIAPNKTSSTSLAPASQPTTQESFFKNVSKRLQLLEQNSTLSLKYIEEQSRNLREAFNKVEKRQLAKSTTFLESLNATVLAELRQFGKQYDQIWQSTVFELESQRDLLSRETIALSSRLTLLADELVFQKRMAIVQSVLLLLCMGLVLFSRFLPGGVEMRQGRGMSSNVQRELDHSFDSVSGGPVLHQVSRSPQQRQPWGHRHQRSGYFQPSMVSQSLFDSPATPLSNFSENEEEYRHHDGEYADERTSGQFSRDSPCPGGSPNGRRVESLDPAYTQVPMDNPGDSGLLPPYARSYIGPNGKLTPEYDSDYQQNYRSTVYVDQAHGSSSPQNRASLQQDGEVPRRFSIMKKPLPALPK
ncbi:hypothetical protein VC83_00532 [Pseudogymnoascus destructans]|uniref:SUN-like protein 1 n=2 Tax=Pseudogymnoascus destructans TaxID=655981 RepID=L8GBI7_PSED2|nr:uncharacterized protein VC83_00532 [Pseudogymnoascus destructans]ELR10442.1 hypothetical protein GMDG_00854 [Pseudogymnoascus destructans 20631-21]OAF62983.1 hypothetical protein VC83_00532 [Pseudogymnoascus destructans]